MLTADEICVILKNNNYEVFIVGGEVRDYFLGINPDDVDIVTSANPEEIHNIFKKYQCRIDSVGANFLVTIVDGIDIATYRKDIYNEFGRRNTISKIAKTLKEDIARRDYTINSIAMCPFDGEIFDYFNGLYDIKNRTIKFVGNPKIRILEDPLRMLRGCRFCATLNGHFDPDSTKAIKKYSRRILEVSPERFRLELLKAMKYKYASQFFYKLLELGLMQYLIPEFEECVGFSGGTHHDETIFMHSMMCGDAIKPSKKTGDRIGLIKLAAYLHDIGKPRAYIECNDGTFVRHEEIGAEMTEKILSRLRFGSDEVKFICNLIDQHMRGISKTKKGHRRMLKRFEELDITFEDFMRIRVADNIANFKYQRSNDLKTLLKLYRDIRDLNTNPEEAFNVKSLKIDGFDIMNILDIKPGKIIGNILKELLELVMDEELINDKEILSTYIKENYGQ